MANNVLDVQARWDAVAARGSALTNAEYAEFVAFIWNEAREDAEALWQLGIRLGMIRSFNDIDALLARRGLPAESSTRSEGE